jgi:hypothetical protein
MSRQPGNAREIDVGLGVKTPQSGCRWGVVGNVEIVFFL